MRAQIRTFVRLPGLSLRKTLAMARPNPRLFRFRCSSAICLIGECGGLSSTCGRYGREHEFVPHANFSASLGGANFEAKVFFTLIPQAAADLTFPSKEL